MRLQLIAAGIAGVILLGGRQLADVAAQPRSHSAVSARASLEVSGYTDTDAVHVASPTISGSVGNEVTGWSVSGRYLVDAVSAASVDIVSTASPRWFEYRHVGAGAVDYKTGDVAVSLSGGVSREPDYLSRNAGLAISVDTLDKNFTPTVAVSYGWDDSGRTGLPRERWEGMQRLGVQAGATFVIGRSTIASFTADGIYERGYLAKPYRYVPLFAPGAGGDIPAGASTSMVNDRRLDLRPADALPRARDRYATTLRLAHRFDDASLRVYQRLYADDWQLAASTSDARLMIDLGTHFLIWPHLRLHAQRAVSFWQRAYEAVPGPDGMLGVPAFRTGDRELGALYTGTAGGGVRWFLGPGPQAPWSLSFQSDIIYTRYMDALYVTRRRALFGAFTLDAKFE